MALSNFFSKIFGNKSETEDISIPSARQKIPNEDGYYRMTCPYCLKPFDVWELPFRAPSESAVSASSSHSKPETIQSGGSAPEAGRKRHGGYGQSADRTVLQPQPAVQPQIPVPSASDSTRYFPVEEDRKLKEFCEHVHAQGRTYVLGKVLTLFEPDSEGGRFNGQGIAAVKLLNQDEWIPISHDSVDSLYHKAVVRVRDTYGNETAVRLCPHCHNVMSHDVCLHPNYTFMFMGNTRCGKTVYKIRLLYELSRSSLLNGTFLLNRMFTGSKVDGLDVDTVDALYQETFGKAHRGESDSIAPITQIQFIDPITFSLLKKEGNSAEIAALITFYDFPGEAIWKRRDDPENGWFLSEIEKRINELDGIIFLLDSASVNFIRNALPENFVLSQNDAKDNQSLKTPAQVLAQFQSNFITAEMGGTIPIPICYTFSKCDLLKKVVEDVRNGDTVSPSVDDILPELTDPPVCVTNWDEQGLHDLYKNRRESDDFDPVQWSREQRAYRKNRRDRHTTVDMQNILASHRELSALFQDEIRSAMTVSPKGLLFALSAVGAPIKKNEAILENPPIRLTEPLEYLMWQVGLVGHDPETLESDEDRQHLRTLRIGK